MTKRSKFFSYLIPLLIFVAALVLLTELMQPDPIKEIKYSDMVKLFSQGQVEKFTVDDDGYVYMKLVQPIDGNETVCHELADLGIFYEDLHETIDAQVAAGTLKDYDYVPVHPTPWYLQMLPYLAIGIVMLLLFYLLMARSANGGNAPKFNRANFRMGAGGNKVTFDDVAGAKEEKQELGEVVDFLRNPKKYRDIGAKVPKGVLLVGPPGTGKTMLAKAVAGEAEVAFFSISGSDFVELYVGVGASRVRDLFEQAKKVAPAIIFIDEIDAVGRRRGAGLGGGHDEREQTLNQLLVEMDGFTGNEGIIVLAATNRHDILDPALLRPGRFDRQIYVGAPDVHGRLEILQVHAKNKSLAEDVDLQVIARATSGFTGADLANLLNEAALLSARKNCPVISMATLEEAIIKVIAGPEKRNHMLNAAELRNTAYHEAGHAVASYFLPNRDPVRQITIVPRGRALGMTIYVPEEEHLTSSRNRMLDELVSLLGGRVAEKLIFDDVTTGAANDLKRATEIAHEMIAKFGMSDRIGVASYDNGSEIFVGRDYERTKSYSEKTAGAIDDEIKVVLDAAFHRCENILQENLDKLHAVAQFLLKNETMSRLQFEACMKGEPIPDTQESFFQSDEK